MALIYNHEWHNRLREIAVTDIDDLIVGETYYSNTHPDSFVLTGLLTNKEAYSKSGLDWDNERIADEIGWFETETGQHYSLSDHGVTEQPYNPWMIFKTAEERDACKALLKVEFDGYDDYYGYDEE